MKLAIEHLKQSVAASERAREIARDAMKAAQRQVEEHAAALAMHESRIADFTLALAELRKPVASEQATVVEKIVKAEAESNPPQQAAPIAPRQPPRATLTTKGS